MPFFQGQEGRHDGGGSKHEKEEFFKTHRS
jgi:hypothetical protein